MLNLLSSIKKKDCSGCGACMNVCPTDAISFKPDEYGFDYPEIDNEKCIKCKKCVAACAYTVECELHTPRAAYGATNRNKNILMKSASGGVFSALADHVLSQAGAVCGCVYDENLMPVHICTEKQDEVVLMRKSKYVQSNIGLVYRDILGRLKKGQLVLFTGTPCQVAALYAVVGKKYTNLLTADLICHGVPSRMMFQKFLEYLQNKYNTKITQFDFRSKKYSWSRFTAEFTNEKGKRKNIGKVNEFYLSAFTGGNILRPNCFNCRFACSTRVGDFTMGDFWGHAAIDLKCDKKKGISIFTVNTDAALNLMTVLSEKLILDKVDYEIAVNGNTCLRHPTVKGKQWDNYMQALKADKIPEIAHRYKAANKRKILRGTVKLFVPIALIQYMEKRKYRK